MTMMAGCVKEVPQTLPDTGGIAVGEPVAFTTMVPDTAPKTRVTKDEWETEIKSYKAVNRGYEFTVEMWREGASQAAARGTYKPVSEIDADSNISYDTHGDLYNSNDAPLYWEDNVNRWGFRATAGTETVQELQNTQELWLAQDRLVGYGYLPLWEGENEGGHAADKLDGLNYRTNKEWYAGNKLVYQQAGIMAESDEEFKKIPLYMQHQRSWITIILKAGEGVTREALAYATSGDNIATTIYSYAEGETKGKSIQAWSSEEFIDYVEDKNGAAASHVSTTRYDAIVEPHNFIASRKSEEEDIIASINVSNQKFTFAAANDFNYGNYIAAGVTDAQKALMNVYNLKPGKHLTITAALSRASRMIMITAWVEDWTETVTQTICDDYGQNGAPVLINNKDELKAFLTSEDNKAGNVGMIVPNAMSLLDDDIADESERWGSYTLKATLNLASAKLTIGKQFLDKIERTGSVINGELIVADSFNDKTAVANVNEGTIERVRVTTSGETSPARASVAGLVDINYGTISKSSSSLTVYGNFAESGNNYVGGIAAKNLFKEAGMLPVIESCTVTARVDGNENVTAGGGIVGQAEGRVSNNDFEYGISLMQNGSRFQNIIAAIGTGHNGLTVHSNNAWPTTSSYIINGSNVTITNRNESATFDAVIDNQEELKTLLTSEYNIKDKCYKVANSFSVEKESWIWRNDVLNNDYFAPNSTATYAHGTVRFKLDGNGKTITLTGTTYATMLFGSIIGEVYDLNLYLDKPVVADRIMSVQNPEDDTNTDAIAAFCYSVTVTGDVAGSIRNISLKAKSAETYIQSTTPAGISVWATEGGVITNCVSNAPVKMELSSSAGVDARHYAGGIVACAHKATITQCKYYNANGIGWESESARKNNCRYGGIVGGTSEITDSHENPSLVMSECYSWWDLPTFSEDILAANRPVMGSVIGSTVYHDPQDATKLYNAMAEGNVGNWWVGTVGAGYTPITGIDEEKAIGKKNSVPPAKPQGW